MFGGRRRLPVLGELAGPAEGDGPWSLGARDLEALEEVRKRLGGRRVVLVTGGGGDASTLAVGLAGASAASGQDTVLLDCDLGRAGLAVEVGLMRSPGLHEYLRWEATPQEILQPLALAGPASAGAKEPLAFVAAGRPAADPATLLGLQSFRHMSGKLRSAYEQVVIAGPPLDGPAAPLRAIAPHVDGALVAIGREAADGRARRALRAALRRLGVEPLGAVVVA
jgi:Mrp family chromosome partitioning ATPase